MKTLFRCPRPEPAPPSSSNRFSASDGDKISKRLSEEETPETQLQAARCCLIRLSGGILKATDKKNNKVTDATNALRYVSFDVTVFGVCPLPVLTMSLSLSLSLSGQTDRWTEDV